MKNGANMKKKTGSRKSVKRKMAAALIVQVEQVGLCLFPCKSKFD